MQTSNDTRPTLIEIFPNTGHQTYVIPLEQLLPKRDESFLRRFATANAASWQPWDDIFPWIRYRYAIENDVPVIFLSVESNLGEPNRGLLIDVEDRIRESAPDEDEMIPFYAAYDEASLEEEFGIDREIPLLSLPQNKQGLELPIKLIVRWERTVGRRPIDVDLIVDLGNSRTVALLLEAPDPGTEMPFERRVRILRFTPRGHPFDYGIDNLGSQLDDPFAIINSWLILHETMFHDLEPSPPFSRIIESDPLKKTSVYHCPVTRNGQKGFQRHVYVPHSFVELSPALIGGGSHPEGAEQVLSRANLDRMAKFFLSSPKRYAWDTTPLTKREGTVWMQIPNGFDGDDPYRSFRELGGLLRCFMHTEDPRFDWDIDNQPSPDRFTGLPFLGEVPSYPRRDAICWYALSVIEAAHRQINSPGYIHSSNREPRARRLRNIRVTYPAGWTHEERTLYFQQWQRAINLFSLVRHRNTTPVSISSAQEGGERPIMAPSPLDEAVCSQIPIIYSDLNALGNAADQWINLYGNGRSTTVMNIDIGGGTTDVAINRYRVQERSAGIGAQLNYEIIPDLRFRHGSKVAGDALVKRIIEKVVIPAWLKASCRDLFDQAPDAQKLISFLFRSPSDGNLAGVDAKAMAKLVRFLRLCLIPVANELLGRLIREDQGGGWGSLSLDKIVSKEYVADFNALVKRLLEVKSPAGRRWRGDPFPVEGIRLNVDRDVLVSCIDQEFERLVEVLADLAGRHRCDLVIVSGKPSELPRLRELMVRRFPILPQRIIHVKSFPAGRWYPFKTMDSDRITDAKTCTVVGAALFQDMCNGALSGFSIRPANLDELSRRFCWGFVRRNMLPRDFFARNNLIFRPSQAPAPRPGDKLIEHKRTIKEFPLNVRIGRQVETMKDLPPDPIYELALDPEKYPTFRNPTADITLRWVSRKGEGESIELLEVKPSASCPDIDPRDVRLVLNTLLEESFWLDDPSLEIAPVA